MTHTPNGLYSKAVATLKPSVNHKRTPDSERRYVVTVNGQTVYTDSPSRVARLTQFGTVGQVVDRHA